MRLSANPLASSEFLIEDVRLAFIDEVRGTLERIERIMSRLEGMLRRAPMNGNLPGQFDELVRSVVANDSSILLSGPARGWLQIDTIEGAGESATRRSIFVPHLSFASLAYRSGVRNSSGTAATDLTSRAKMRERLSRERNLIAAQKKRLQMTIDRNKAQGILRTESQRLLRAPVLSQQNMLKMAKETLNTLLDLLLAVRRLREQRESDQLRRSEYDDTARQLLEEFDSSARAGAFNDLTLFRGDFSRDAADSELWFYDSSAPGERRRIFFPELSTRALGFRDDENELLPLSDGQIPGVCEEAIATVLEARRSVARHLIWATRQEEPTMNLDSILGGDLSQAARFFRS